MVSLNKLHPFFNAPSCSLRIKLRTKASDVKYDGSVLISKSDRLKEDDEKSFKRRM